MRRKKFISKYEWHPVLSPDFVSVDYGLHFWYPTRNRFGVACEYSHRAILVQKVECLSDTGTAVEWIKRAPLVRRGAWLVTGIDIELKQERSFYWEAMRHRRVRDAGPAYVRPDWFPAPPAMKSPFPLPALRLGFHDPSDNGHGLIDWVDRPFSPSKSDRLLLKDRVMQIEEAYSIDLRNLELAAFPVKARAA